MHILFCYVRMNEDLGYKQVIAKAGAQVQPQNGHSM